MNTVAIGLDERTALELRQLARERAVEPSAPAGEAIRPAKRAALLLAPRLKLTLPAQSILGRS